MASDEASLAVGLSTGVVSLQGMPVWMQPLGAGRPPWLERTDADPRFEPGAAVWLSRAGGVVRGTLVGVGIMPMLRRMLAGSDPMRPFVGFRFGPRFATVVGHENGAGPSVQYGV
jgi:hypothetical protein